MNKTSQIQLNLASFLNVPFQTYDQFFFIVNGEKFETNRIIADLLSPDICQIHLIDRTFDTFIINTCHRGDFNYILNLAKCQQIDLAESEIPFISEVVEILNNSSIQYKDDFINSEITEDNIFQRIKKHENCYFFYKNFLPIEIDFVSSHFFEFCEKYEEELLNISLDTIFLILSNEKLHLNSEDQLIQFINKLYSNDSKYSILYDTVLFENVSVEMMKQFISLYNHNDMSRTTWNRLSARLVNEIYKQESEVDSGLVAEKEEEVIRKIHRYGVTIEYSEQNVFKGILYYLQNKKTIFDIITSYDPKNIDSNNGPQNILFDQNNSYFMSPNEKDGWIGFDFKYHRIIPTHYTIKSPGGAGVYDKLINWAIEGSNDRNSWEILDKNDNYPFLRGILAAHTFSISKEITKDFRFIHIRITDVNSHLDRYIIRISAFEVYGRLI